jgi:hypothetical protein
MFLIQCRSDCEKSLQLVKEAANAAWLNRSTKHVTWRDAMDAMNILRAMSEVMIRTEQVSHAGRRLVSAWQVTAPLWILPCIHSTSC